MGHIACVQTLHLVNSLQMHYVGKMFCPRTHWDDFPPSLHPPPFQPWQIQVCIRPVHIQPESGLLPELIPVSSTCSDKEYLYSPHNWMLVYNRVIAALNLLVPISYSQVERCTVRVMSLARFKPGPLDIGIYHTNHWATMPTRWLIPCYP